MSRHQTRSRFSENTLQLLPLFAPFQPYFIPTAELIEEYLCFLLDHACLRARPLGTFYELLDELVAHGWWSKPYPNWEILLVHPQLSVLANRYFWALPPAERCAVQSCFVRYYHEIIVPKSLRPYWRSTNPTAHSMGRFVGQHEVENLRRAVEWSLQLENTEAFPFSALDDYWRLTQQTDNRLEFTAHLLRELSDSAPHQEWRSEVLFIRANALRTDAQLAAAQRTVIEGLQQLPAADPRRALFQQQLGNLLQDQGKSPTEVSNHYKKAMSVYESFGDESKLAEMYQNLATLSWQQRDFKAMISLTEQSLHLYEQQDRPYFQAMAHQNLAAAYLETGHPADALAAYETAETLLPVGYNHERATLARSMGVLYSQDGDFERAEACFHRALVFYLGSSKKAPPDALGILWYDLGSLALRRGNTDEALDYYQRAVNTRTSALGRGRALHMLAFVHADYRKNCIAALPFYTAALRAFEEAPLDSEWCEACFNFGNALLELKRTDEARQHYETATRWFESTGQTPTLIIAHLYHNLTLSCCHNGDVTAVIKYLALTRNLYLALKSPDDYQQLLQEVRELGYPTAEPDAP